jgi:hypothetical protein
MFICNYSREAQHRGTRDNRSLTYFSDSFYSKYSSLQINNIVCSSVPKIASPLVTMTQTTAPFAAQAASTQSKLMCRDKIMIQDAMVPHLRVFNNQPYEKYAFFVSELMK